MLTLRSWRCVIEGEVRAGDAGAAEQAAACGIELGVEEECDLGEFEQAELYR
jgi:hypothetical protein